MFLALSILSRFSRASINGQLLKKQLLTSYGQKKDITDQPQTPSPSYPATTHPNHPPPHDITWLGLLLQDILQETACLVNLVLSAELHHLSPQNTFCQLKGRRVGGGTYNSKTHMVIFIVMDMFYADHLPVYIIGFTSEDNILWYYGKKHTKLDTISLSLSLSLSLSHTHNI